MFKVSQNEKDTKTHFFIFQVLTIVFLASIAACAQDSEKLNTLGETFEEQSVSLDEVPLTAQVSPTSDQLETPPFLMPTEVPVSPTPNILKISPVTNQFAIIGYDLTSVDKKDGWITYTIGIALANTSDKFLENYDFQFDSIYVEALDGETYPAEFYQFQRAISANHSVFLAQPTVKYPFGDHIFLPPSSTVLEIMEPYRLFGVKDVMSFGVSWGFLFSVPEGEELKKIVVPGVANIDLTNVVSRSEIMLAAPNRNQEMPISLNLKNSVELILKSPRQITNQIFGSMLAIDVEVSNRDLLQNQQIRYLLFFLLDRRGAGTRDYFTNCEDPESDSDLSSPILNIELEPDQSIEGVVCVFLNPSGYNKEVEELWTWQTLETINPREIGLDPESTMQVKGVEATYDELRNGIELLDGTRLRWIGNKRIGRLQIEEKQVSTLQVPLLSNTHTLYIEAGLSLTGESNWYSLAIDLND